MKISQIVEKDFCYDSRNIKKNDIFFDFLSDSKNNNPYLRSIIQKKPFLIITKKKLIIKIYSLLMMLKRFIFP